MGHKIQQSPEDIKPEAGYYSERKGKRGAIMIVDVAEPSSVPSIVKPFFLTFGATVEFRVVMSPDDLSARDSTTWEKIGIRALQRR